MKKFRNLHETQKFAIVIPALFFLSCLTKHYLENFRGTLIYAYGSTITLFLSLFLVLFSLVNSILILRDLKIKLIQKLLWFLLSALPFLYLSIGLIFSI
ncbi:hypothetical protein ASD98_17970 [Flavobacterium sp. Root186]|nr:hypothetical protein ASD98_17970 [Flavobacterium sp. Root186]